MKKLTSLVLLLMSATSTAAEPNLLASVDAGLQGMIDDSSARAIVVGLYDHGDTQVVAYGRLSSNDDTAPDANTVFEIGSVSKVFTTLLAQKQVDSEKLAWNDPISRHMSDVAFAASSVASITLAELAGHVSGLPRLPDNMESEDPMDPYAGYDRQKLEDWLTAYQPQAVIKTYAYSNLGMGILGEIASDAAGLSLHEAYRRDVLLELGLGDTGIEISAAQKSRLAQGYSAGADMPNWAGFDAMAGAGALLSTTSDMLRFIDANLSNESASLEAVADRARNAETAFGWHKLQTKGGEVILWHNGGTGGYASFLAIRPETQTGVVILTASTEAQEVTELGFVQITGQEDSRVGIDLAPYAGAYELSPQLVLTIFEDNGKLMGQATGQAAFPLAPAGEHEFVLPAADIRIVFNLDAAGSTENITFTQGGSVMTGVRVDDSLGAKVYKPIEIAEAELQAYVGEYQLAPNVVITVIANGKQLFAQLSGQAAFPVFAYEKDKFFYKVVDAQLFFERNEAGSVEAVVLNQGGQQRAPIIK